MMSAGGQPPHHHVGQPGNAAVGPGVTAVWSYVENTKGPHRLESLHMPVTTSHEAHSVRTRHLPVVIAAGSAALMAVIAYLNALDNPVPVKACADAQQ